MLLSTHFTGAHQCRLALGIICVLIWYIFQHYALPSRVPLGSWSGHLGSILLKPNKPYSTFEQQLKGKKPHGNILFEDRKKKNFFPLCQKKNNLLFPFYSTLHTLISVGSAMIWFESLTHRITIRSSEWRLISAWRWPTEGLWHNGTECNNQAIINLTPNPGLLIILVT